MSHIIEENAKIPNLKKFVVYHISKDGTKKPIAYRDTRKECLVVYYNWLRYIGENDEVQE